MMKIFDGLWLFLHVAAFFITGLLFFTGTALAADEFQYHTMFPSLQQPWYFWGPSGITATEKGNILIADTQNNRLLKYNIQGQLITTWGRFGDNPGEFDKPSAVAVDASGNVYVLDSGNSRIQKFDGNGTFLLSWGSQGNGAGEFQFLTASSTDIALDAEGNVFVTDYGNNRVQIFSDTGSYLGVISGGCPDICVFDFIVDGGAVEQTCRECLLFRPSGLAFDALGNLYVSNQGVDASEAFDSFRRDNIVKFSPSGDFLYSFGGAGDGDGELMNPSGMTFDKDNHLFVADSGNHRIQVFSIDGIWIDSFGTKGLGDGEFNTPSDIVFASDDILFIADRENNRIEKFHKNKTHINSWASGGSARGAFSFPAGIAVDSKNNFYVADTNNHRIQKLDTEGNVLMVIGEYGEGEAQFRRPFDVTVDLDGNIFVADTLNNRIQKFNSQGTFLFAWGELGLEEGTFERPLGIAADTSGNIYVVEEENARVQKFTNNGRFLLSWGGGSGEGRFRITYGIAVDARNNVYVSDYYNAPTPLLTRHRVQKFTSEGEFIMSWGSLGSEPGEFYSPRGVATDAAGNVYVADMFNDRIQKFTGDGEFLGSAGAFGSGQGQLIQPTDVAVTGDGTMFVADSFNNRISVFKPVVETEPISTKMALIVAGGGPYPGNILWDTTRTCANFAYRTLLQKGYPKDSIFYLCDDNGLDIDGNGIFDDVYGPPAPEAIKAIITEVASNAEELLLYFVDHGSDGVFSLDNAVNLLVPTLDQWLDTYEAVSGGRTLLVYDACRSGSFLSSLTPFVHGSRTVITSSGSDEYAYFISSGTISFSEYFWTSVFNGHDLLTAFMQAKDGLNILEISQNPQADADGNGIGNETSDFDLLSSSTAFSELFTGEAVSENIAGREELPVIGDVLPMTIVEEPGQALVSAKGVTGTGGIDRVWATILSPSYTPGSPDIPVTELPEIDLKPLGTGDSGIYQAWYDKFTESGAYRVTFYARDKRGNNANPVTSLFLTEESLLPKAIIMTSNASEPAATAIYEYLGNHAKNALTAQGFSEDRIKIIHGAAGAELQSAIVDWASDTDNLTVFFVGDGQEATLIPSPGNRISATALSSYLDLYQSSTSGHVNVIIDADDSGGFISELKNTTGFPRIVISSTEQNGKAFFETNGLVSFSSYFWGGISKGTPLLDAFIVALNAVDYLSQSFVSLGLSDVPQKPMIDDNGNGIPNEDADGSLAVATHIGIGIITGKSDYITGEIQETLNLDGKSTAILTVSNLISANQISRVWATITPPATPLLAPGMQTDSESQARGDESDRISDDAINAFSLSMVNLIPSGDGTYQWAFNGFTGKGTYLVDFYAMDEQGNVELLGRTTILQNQVAEEPIRVGGKPHHVFGTVPFDSHVVLALATSVAPAIQENIKGEWLVFASITTDGGMSCYLLSPLGMVDACAPGTDIWNYTFPFDHKGSFMDVASVRFSSLGLEKGDLFAYAYVYTTASSMDDIFHENAVYAHTVILHMD